MTLNPVINGALCIALDLSLSAFSVSVKALEQILCVHLVIIMCMHLCCTLIGQYDKNIGR